MAIGIHTLAYGHHAVSKGVELDAPAGGEDGDRRGLPAAEARNRRIPLRKQKDASARQDMNEYFTEARRGRDATLQDGDLVANDPPTASALASTGPARLDAWPPRFSSSTRGTTLYKAATIHSLGNDLNLNNSIHSEKIFSCNLWQFLKLCDSNQTEQSLAPATPPPPASSSRSNKRKTDYLSVMDPYLRRVGI